MGWSAQVDAPAGYDAQRTCRSTPQPGTAALARWLLRSYPSTGSMGMIRGCGVGGTSEHKDGRAFDWAADVARPATKRAAYDFIRRALATDSAGNTHALARRLGIMYFIYNDTIWASYRDFAPRAYLNSGCATRAKCSRSLRHLNHVHISLGYAGAAAQTSWYRSRNVPSLAVRYPGTNQLDPDLTAVTKLTVPATGTVVTSPYALKAGVTYRLVATGTLRYADGTRGDAHCNAADPAWLPTDRVPIELPPTGPFRTFDWHGGWGGSDQAGSEHEDSPSNLPTLATHGLTFAGGLRWGDVCRADHTYEAWYTPAVNQKLMLKYVDAAPADNAGNLTVYVARDDITAGSLVRK
ncbi:MAG: hypothetical protein NTV23_10785 [Propionibacteriales bacterium]|nr:hypothetical protein [Propionibacteriales bacterium]